MNVSWAGWIWVTTGYKPCYYKDMVMARNHVRVTWTSIVYLCYRLYAHKIYPRISSDHMRNLAIKYFARIDAYRARIVGVIPHIVSIFTCIVRPNLVDTNFGWSCHTGALFLSFSCVTMGQLVFSRKLCTDGDRRLRIDIQTELPLFSKGDSRSHIDIWALLPVCAMVHQQSLIVQKPASRGFIPLHWSPS